MDTLQDIQTRLSEVIKIMELAEKNTDDEYERTSNTWMDCYKSRIFQVETLLLGTKLATRYLHPELIEATSKKIESLKKRVALLGDEYPDRSVLVPYEIKLELFVQLRDVIKLPS